MKEELFQLEQKPDAFTGKLPVISKLQELPYEELTWENFERLCYSLIRLESNIEASFYGVRGNDQQGIDIYSVSRIDDTYTVYQCKREKDYTPSKISAAVDTFLTKEWAKIAKTFVLCTMESLSKKDRADEVIAQREKLSNKGIQLIIWDKTSLDSQLKNQVEIVSDFFGLEWVKAFCSELDLTKLTRRICKQSFQKPDNYLQRKIIPVELQGTFYRSNKQQALLDVVRINRLVVLLGDAGLGKTIELRNLAYELAELSYFPTLINLNVHTKTIEQKIPDFELIPQSMLVVCLDGLDEVQASNFDLVRRQIIEFSQQYPQVKIVVSCRQNFYSSQDELNASTLNGFKAYVLEELDLYDAYKYIQSILTVQSNIFIKEIQDKQLENLLTIPYYLIYLARQFQAHKVIANSRAELFNGLLREMIDKDLHRYYPSEINRHIQAKKLIEKIAFSWELQGKNNGEWSQLSIALNDSEQQLIQRLGSIITGEASANSHWKFVHNNVQEYLAASVLARQDLDTIKQTIAFPSTFKRLRPSWINTLSFLVSILEEKKPLRDNIIEWLIENQPANIIKFEANKLGSKLRHEVFVKIFLSYKQKNTPINHRIINYEQLAKFSKTRETLLFLNGELQKTGFHYSQNSALSLTPFFDSKNEFTEEALILKESIRKIVLGAEKELWYNSIKAYSEAFDLSDDEYLEMFNYHSHSNDTWIRYALFESIYKQGQQDNLLDYVFSKILSSLNEDNDTENVRLGNERDELVKCIKSIQETVSLKKLLDFIANNFDEINNDAYYGDIFTFTFKALSEKLPSDFEVQAALAKFVLKYRITYNEDKLALVKKYFDVTQERIVLFKALSSVNDNEWNRYKGHLLAKIATKECIDWFVTQYPNNESNKSILWDFLVFLSPSDGLQDYFQQIINVNGEYSLKSSKDHEIERTEDQRLSLEVLFDSESYKSAVISIFKDLGKDELTFGEVWEHQRNQPVLKVPSVVYNAITRKDNASVNAILSNVEKNWASLSIKGLYRYLKEHKEIQLTIEQQEQIVSWLLKTSKEIDFESAITLTPNGFSVNILADIVSFFIRRLKVYSLPPELYLSMLSFYAHNDGEEPIFNFVQKTVEKEKVTNKVLKNLAEKPLSSEVFHAHVTYCVENDLKQAVPILSGHIERADVYSTDTLNTYIKLGGSLSDIEPFIDNVSGYFKHSFISILIEHKSPTIKKKVRELFSREADEDEKLEYAKHLVNLQDLIGVNYYCRYIKRSKAVPDDSSPSNPLLRLKHLRFLPQMFKLYYLSFNGEVNGDRFHDLTSISTSAIANISLHKENLSMSKKYFRAFKLIIRIVAFFKHIKTHQMLSRLEFLYENLEQQYYVSKSSETLSFEEAIKKYKALS